MHLGQDYYEIFGQPSYPGAEFPVSFLYPRDPGEIDGGGGGGIFYPPGYSISYPAPSGEQPTYRVTVEAPYYVEEEGPPTPVVKAGFPWWILLLFLGLVVVKKK